VTPLCAACGEPLPAVPAVAHRCTPEAMTRVSDLADAGCTRLILILHPNFKLPEGFHLGAAAHDKHGWHAHGRTA